MESITFDPNGALRNAIMVKKFATKYFDETDWNLVKALDEKNHTLLECKNFEGYPLPHYRAKTTVNLPREELVDIVWNASLESAKLDDPGIESLDILEEHEGSFISGYKVRRQVNNLPWPCWPRETVFSQFRFEDDDDSTWIVGFSVNHPRAPTNNSKFVRTNVELSVYKYTTIDSNTTCVQRIANVNPNGSIPEFVIKNQANRLVNAFNRWYSLGKK